VERFKLRMAFAGAAMMLAAAEAGAHMLKTDGDIGVLMHVDPNDEPVAREPATFFFEIKDRSGHFSGAECDCRLKILREDRQIADQPAQAGQTGVAAKFSFPEAGMYRVELNGAPVAQGRFARFSVPFDLRVERSGAPGSSRLWLALAVVAGAGLLASAAWAIIRVLRDMGRKGADDKNATGTER
jgi:hypothetical protein